MHKKENNKLPHHHIISMLRLLSTIWFLTNQCVKNHSVMAKTHVEGQNEIQDKMVSACVDSQFPLYLRPNIILYDHKQLGLGNKWKWESSNIKTILTRISCCALQSTHISSGTWIEVDVIHYSGKSVHFKFHLSKVCLHWSFIFSLDFIIWGDVERWLTKTICQCN